MSQTRDDLLNTPFVDDTEHRYLFVDFDIKEYLSVTGLDDKRLQNIHENVTNVKYSQKFLKIALFHIVPVFGVHYLSPNNV